MTNARPRWEWPVVTALLLLAFALRVLALNDVPPGLHHDEVIIGQVAKDILRGNVAIYFTAGYGHEPLYHYIVAGFFAALGASAFALRLTSAFIAVLGLAVAYRFTRRLFSPAVAIGTLAWMSMSLWPVFFARVGLRGITLPLLTTLTAYFLWKAIHASRIILYVFAGAWLGLTLYTYQASRVFPVIFAVFFVYLTVTRSARSPQPSALGRRRVGAFFVTALLVAAPLIIYLTVINPAAEERVADLSGPLNQLRAGNPSEVIQSTLNTLGMFTVRGDAVPIYNVADRPVFPEPIGAALFYLGFLICLWRWKQPASAFMLIWFFVSLVPAMVTPFSPNFVRTIAAWPVPFVFVGVAMNEVRERVVQRFGSKGQAFGLRDWASEIFSSLEPLTVSLRQLVVWSSPQLITLACVLLLLANLLGTARDYFTQWPNGDYVRFWQQANWTQAVRFINSDRSSTPIAATGLSIHDFDPQTFDLLNVRTDLKVKWYDCRSALILTTAPTTRYLSPDYFPCDADLELGYLPNTHLVAEPHWPDSSDKVFTLREFRPPWSLPEVLLPLTVRSVYGGPENFDATFPASNLNALRLPLDFDGLRLWGTDNISTTLPAGRQLVFDSFWEARAALHVPLKIFIHVSAADGKMVAQWDGLDVNVATLDAGDVFIQRHRLDLPADLPPGSYRISLGIYQPDNGQRLVAHVADRGVDSIVLTNIDVK